MKDSDGFIWQIIINGHANYCKSGKDIVCSAVSVTAYTAIGALEELIGFKPEELYKDNDGYMICSIPYEKMNNMSDEKKLMAKTIMETTLIGFKQIQLGYKKYVKVIEENCG